MIIENSAPPPAQNTYANERLVFDTLEPFPASGCRRWAPTPTRAVQPGAVAVSLGPEHGTVGPEQAEAAAKEAMQG
ncbi:MAG: hypothetical protein R2853_11175 [Thermomicrobiales bacterium]